MLHVHISMSPTHPVLEEADGVRLDKVMRSIFPRHQTHTCVMGILRNLGGVLQESIQHRNTETPKYQMSIT